MDERVFLYKAGLPIPDWDLNHRLPIDKPVGPECKDTSTIFRLNSTYMDVTDQPYRDRQWQAGGVLLACLGVALGFWMEYETRVIFSKSGGLFGDLFCLGMVLIFGYVAFKFGRDEFFSLRRRPIRFNREQKKIYAIRRRRFFAKSGEGDVTLEVPWSEKSIFCIHRGSGNNRNCYHIRHYAVDNSGNVVQAFAIGREWEGRANLEGLLSQWNYWCWYMNQGPADLPKPPLFFSEHENMRESFLFCMYDFGTRASATYRIIMMPFILLMTSHRLLALWTCREPVWPKSVEQVSAIATADAYSQPRGDTPVGWAETALAQERHDYPYDPKMELDGWHGEKDGAVNASLWAEDVPPKI
ncbi:DUF6708 domain-containing protein [Collimonas pratensis]|uniref:DUF6708 domain-containing protein n=1 Tax=Collimonas pratensis TaxID=279113 RepID=A0A127Q0C4_9BURK|nr:DUF6708 domain-containing protein [Collimonas pratensis]AMP03479.1 hypothetical protein CPter91_1094 [Collimonas pratensis]